MTTAPVDLTTEPDPPDDGSTHGVTDSGNTAAEQILPAARAAVGIPTAAWLGVLLSVALIALGLTLLREVLVGRTVADTVPVPGEPWLGPVLSDATSVVTGTTAVVVGSAAAVLGVMLLVAALTRRPRLTMGLLPHRVGDLVVEVDARSVAALAADAALRHPDVVTSRASATRRRLVMDVSTDPRDQHDEATLVAEVIALVDGVLVDLQPQLRSQVRVHGTRDG